MESGEPRLLDDLERPPERLLVFRREADDHVGGEVEVAQRPELRDVLLGGVAPPHRAKNGVVAGLQGHVEVTRRRGRLAERRDEVVREVIDLDRRESQALDAGQCAGLANEPRQRVTGLAIPEAAEVHAGQDDLAMTLGDATLDLAQHRIGTTTARRPANERDHAERAREGAAVLDLHEGASALEPGVGLDAAERADAGRDGDRHLLARQRNDRHVRCRAVEGSSEICATPGHVHAAVTLRRARDGLA